MANECIYTGAQLRVEPYGFVIPADLYRQGHSIIARMNHSRCQSFDSSQLARATHLVELSDLSGIDFFHEDAGILIAPAEAFRSLPACRPDNRLILQSKGSAK
jgi:hypothetical protein